MSALVEQCILFAITKHYPTVCIDNNPAHYAHKGVTLRLVYTPVQLATVNVVTQFWCECILVEFSRKKWETHMQNC